VQRQGDAREFSSTRDLFVPTFPHAYCPHPSWPASFLTSSINRTEKPQIQSTTPTFVDQGITPFPMKKGGKYRRIFHDLRADRLSPTVILRGLHLARYQKLRSRKRHVIGYLSA